MASSELALIAPLSGPVVPLASVPDAVFSTGMMGDGLAIDPTSQTLRSPCDGVVSQLHRAGHAVAVQAPNGAEILMHIGIDTVSLAGRGFEARVAVGDVVRAGQELVRFDADAIASAVPCLQTLVLVTSGDSFGVAWRAAGAVTAGESPLLTLRPAPPKVATPEPVAAAPEGLERRAEAVVAHAGGLHARPAAMVQSVARPFAAEVLLRRGSRQASIRSVVSLMGLGLAQGERVEVIARGTDAAEALAAVVRALQAEGSFALEAPPAPAPARAAPDPSPASTTLTAGSSPGFDDPGTAIRGVCAAPGLCVGRVFRLDASSPTAPVSGGTPEVERAGLRDAVARIRKETQDAIERARRRNALQEAGIFAAHLALLDDPAILEAADSALEAGRSAGAAFQDAIGAQCTVLAGLGNPLLAERVSDLRDLERRVLRSLYGDTGARELPENSVVVADDLGPSDLTRLPLERLAGLCTARGGATSHVAILARSLGVPALVALGAPALARLDDGVEVILDASAGRVDPSPAPEQIAATRSQMAARSSRREQAAAGAKKPAKTLDGHEVEVAANVANEQDARAAAAHGADGIGLLRTELLFVDRADAPSDEEQARAYQAVVDALEGRPVIIRTLDVGNDKELPFLPMPQEPNPALGLRGIRSSFVDPRVLETQLRALVQVRPSAACRIMLPMITDASELRRVRERLRAIANALGVEPAPQLGVMIEVPSAALLADQLALEADFFSIGTNDLTQYTLAMDRCHPGLAPLVDALHPAVLRLIARTVEGAATRQRPVGVCGALASDLEAVPVLVGLGVHELSVSPNAVPEVKARIRSLDFSRCRDEARALLALDSAAAVRARAREVWPQDGGAA